MLNSKMKGSRGDTEGFKQAPLGSAMHMQRIGYLGACNFNGYGRQSNQT
jgi:hypothetical protein